jgi:hypothetical protein
MKRPEVKKVREVDGACVECGKVPTPLSDGVGSFTDEFIFYGIYN